MSAASEIRVRTARQSDCRQLSLLRERLWEAYRRQGIGSRLLAAAEDWALSHGCREMASDTWIDNEVSQRAHTALGFEEVDRCVHYRKALVRRASQL